MAPRKPEFPSETAANGDADAWSRAPRTGVAQIGGDLSFEPADGPVAQGTALARELAGQFRAHVSRALGHMSVGLDDSETSLAFVDHYLRTVRSETRAPILALIAAEAGAYYGELVRATMGGTWIGDGRDPRRLRLLLRDQFLHFSPIDQAFEVVLGGAAEDNGVLEGEPDLALTTLDTEFHARRSIEGPRRSATGDAAPIASNAEAASDDDDESATPDDASWLADRLSEAPPVGADEYYTLTCRFETLKFVLELLATKHVAEGKSPREYHIADYVEALGNRG